MKYCIHRSMELYFKLSFNELLNKFSLQIKYLFHSKEFTIS